MAFGWDDDPDLNITPLVDVMLVLMAILMITAPTITYQEQIDLPQGSKSAKVQKRRSITIRMDKDRRIYWGKEHFGIDTFADDFVNKSASYDKNIDVYIRADERLPYKEVMYLLKTVKAAGFSKVSLVTL